MNIKTFNLLLFTFISISVISQENNDNVKIKVNYGVKTYLDKNLGRHQSLMKAFPSKAKKIETIASELDFSLVFNDSTSLFFLERKLFSDNSVAMLAIIHIGYFGRIKQTSNNYITENLQEDFGKFLVSRPYQIWELQDDNKMIGEYLCFKATTDYVTTNPQGKIFRRKYTAWYTPQLPYKFGPAGYGNLPGLIIELKGEGFSYGVKKIEFYDEDKQKRKEMPKLKNKKLITEEEFEKLAAIDEKRWREKD